MRNPVRAWLRRSLVGGEYLGHLFTGREGTPSETPVLVVPLTEEAVNQTYDRLALAFAGRADRYELASLALDVLGIRPVRRPEAPAATVLTIGDDRVLEEFLEVVNE